MRCIACDQDGVVLPDGCFVCNHCNIHIMPFKKDPTVDGVKEIINAITEIITNYHTRD